MLKEYRKKIQGFSDLLNYCFFVSEGILLLKDGSLCFGLYYRGPDLSSSSPKDMAYLCNQFNSVLYHLGNGWMLHSDLIRKASGNYVSEENCYFPDPTSLLIDLKRREHYLAQGKHFESVYALVFTYKPPPEIETRFKKIFIEKNKETKTYQQILQYFEEKLKDIAGSLQRFFLIERMNNQSFLHHLFYCIHAKSVPLKISDYPIYVDILLGQEDVYSGYEPKIGNHCIRIISLLNFPLESYPGILQILEKIAIPFRWSNRFIFLEKEAAIKLLKMFRRYWFQNRQSMFNLLKEVLFPHQSTTYINQDAENMAQDVNESLEEAESGLVKYGFYTSVIVLHSQNENEASVNTNIILKELENAGFLGKVENINAMEAYLGSLPGHGEQNIRKPLIHTLNYADFMPLYSIWAGPTSHPCRYYGKNAPPLLYAETAGATPFRFFLHHQDVGHTLIVGDTGSGKSTLLGLIALQHLRYKDAQVFIFDKGYSSYILCESLGGQHYDLLSQNQKIAFCPLKNIQHPEDFFLALEWLEIIFDSQGITLNPHLRKELNAALLRLKDQNHKTLTHLQTTLQEPTLKNALEYYTLSGPMGEMLDAEEEMFTNNVFQVFEMSHLLECQNPALIPTLFYIFSKIERSLKGQPVLIIIEEGHRFLAGKFGQRLEIWLRELRKKNVCVIFLTQHLNEIMQSNIKSILLNSCKTKIFLPNAHALDEINVSTYFEIGLNETEMNIIKYAIPKKEYYYSSPSGSRLIHLALDDIVLSFIGVDSVLEREDVKKLIEEYGKQWPFFWLKKRGLLKAAEQWKMLSKKYNN